MGMDIEPDDDEINFNDNLSDSGLEFGNATQLNTDMFSSDFEINSDRTKSRSSFVEQRGPKKRVNQKLAGTVTSVFSSTSEVSNANQDLANLAAEQYRADSLASILSESEGTNRSIHITGDNLIQYKSCLCTR